MSRITVCFLALCVSLFSAAPVPAQYGYKTLISPVVVQRYGLERAWFTQVEVDPSRGQISDMLYFVSDVDSHTVYEVHYEDRKRIFSELDVNRLGEVIGKEKAEEKAKFFVEDLEAREIEAKIKTLQIPETTLYVTTDRGMLHAIDAETGRTRWATVVGNRNYPTERPGACEKYLALLNGSDLHLLKRDTGEMAWTRKVWGVASAGPAISDTYVVVPTFSGNVELYDLEETRVLPELYKSNGRVLIQPTVTALSIAWPTDRGFLYVARASKKGVRYRLEARDTIVSQASFLAPGRFFTASIDGYVYCVHETSGGEMWRFSTGEPISQTPIPVGEWVYTVTDKESLFCCNIETGEEKWWSTGVKRILSISKDRIYGMNKIGRLVILDTNTGARVGTIGLEMLDIYYPNLQSDRIFVASKTGIIQCLRETRQQWPLVHAHELEAEKSKRPEIKQEEMGDAKPKPTPEKPAGGGDPFGGSDPFGGGGGAGGAGGGDPFGGGGGGADPFGGGAGGGGDPFGGGAGGGADPFGGGGDDAGGGDPFGGGADPFN